MPSIDELEHKLKKVYDNPLVGEDRFLKHLLLLGSVTLIYYFAKVFWESISHIIIY